MRKEKGEKLRFKRCLSLVLLLLAVSVVASIGVTRQAVASPARTLNVTIDVSIVRSGNCRLLTFISGDEIVQFTRPNIILGQNTSGAVVDITVMSGTASGDLVGSINLESNSVHIYDPVWKGYIAGKFEFDDGSDNTLKGVIAADQNLTYIEAGVIKSTQMGCLVSTSETGIFSGKKIIGTYSGETVEPDYDRFLGTLTLTLYDAREISGPHSVSVTGNLTGGYLRGMSWLAEDEIVQFTRPNIHLFTDMSVYLEEGVSHTGSTTGYLTGSYCVSQNNLLISYGWEGWTVGKSSYSDAEGTIESVVAIDDLEFNGSTWRVEGYLFALAASTSGKYAGKEFFDRFSGTDVIIEPGGIPGPPTKEELSGSLEVYSMQAIPVGGVWVPVNKFELLAPYTGLTTLLAVAVMTVSYVKKRKRDTEINS